MIATALKREFKQLHEEEDRIADAMYNLLVVEKWIERINADIRQITSVYSSRYTPRISIALESILVDSFNDGELAETLDSLRESLEVAVEAITAKDYPETRCREFVLKGRRGSVPIEYTFRAYLRDNSTCQIIIDGYDEVKTSKFIEIIERQPRMRFVCPED